MLDFYNLVIKLRIKNFTIDNFGFQKHLIDNVKTTLEELLNFNIER